MRAATKIALDLECLLSGTDATFCKVPVLLLLMSACGMLLCDTFKFERFMYEEFKEFGNCTTGEYGVFPCSGVVVEVIAKKRCA